MIEEIKLHGAWAKVEYSLFYLSTSETAEQVAKAVRAKMDENDKLIVIDATRHNAYWYNLSQEVSKFSRSAGISETIGDKAALQARSPT